MNSQGVALYNAIWLGIAIVAVLSLIAGGKILKKAGESPWKILIPIYGIYCLYKVSESQGLFRGILYVSALGTIITRIVSSNIMSGSYYALERPDVTPIIIIRLVVSLITLVIQFNAMKRLADCFGKDTGFAIGLLLLYPIFAMILGFGSAEYNVQAVKNTGVVSTATWKCPKCGHENPVSRAFCQNCGAREENPQ